MSGGNDALATAAAPLRVVYLGSGDIGLPTLKWLARSAPQTQVVGVVTQPDRPAGRHQTLTPPAVKILAQRLLPGVPILQPERLRRPEAVESLRALAPDVLVVFAYGQILPKTVLALPRIPGACLNIHASLLPRWRGAAPIQAALLAGDTESGLTIMWMDAGLDTGDILLARPLPLGPDETAGTLHDRLAALAPAALAEALALVAAGRAPRTPQDAARATHAPKLDRRSGLLDWAREDAATLARRVRALHPWPGAFTTLPGGTGETLKIYPPATALAAAERKGEPGEVLIADPREGILQVAAAGGSALRLHEVQLAGKRRLSAAEFLRGHPLTPGSVLGKTP
ncbi:MAG: methionyl-tRNA formyltransferase [Verrucomicrobia bacterium]|nr:methionyl-tRNA formyltransferase [Verrucomicrobiota bacterium]